MVINFSLCLKLLNSNIIIGFKQYYSTVEANLISVLTHHIFIINVSHLFNSSHKLNQITGLYYIFFILLCSQMKFILYSDENYISKYNINKFSYVSQSVQYFSYVFYIILHPQLTICHMQCICFSYICSRSYIIYITFICNSYKPCQWC